MKKRNNRVPHRAPLTQRMSWAEAKASGLVKRQADLVELHLLSFGPENSRGIALATGIERGSITRCLKNLEDEKRIKIVKIEKCPKTKKAVQYYGICDPDRSQEGHQANLFDPEDGGPSTDSGGGNHWEL